MPLSPAPLMPGHSPLPNPGEPPADRRALRVGAVVGMLALALALLPGQLLLPRLLFLTPGLLARASSNLGVTSGASSFQGFIDLWTRRSVGQGGFMTSGSLANMRSEARDFHMNTVVIPVVADMPTRNGSDIYWHPNDALDLDTLPDQDYLQAIDDARRAGLEPVLELQVKQQDPENKPLEDARFIGETWYGQASGTTLYTDTGSATVGSLEHNWFDNYAAFAVHYAQMAQSKHMKIFIFGDGLSNLTSDGPNSVAAADPQGLAVPRADGIDSSKCTGRHECEWRHVIHALRAATYTSFQGKAQPGGHYSGKLIYAASWEPGDAAGVPGEFETIAWWNAVDAIGIDAFFPLTQSAADVQVSALQDAWHGNGVGLAGQGDIFGRISQIADKTNLPVVFTAAGYESVPGSNNSPGQTASSISDPDEQLNDMQALLQTFTGTPWWIGAIWSYDQPLAPRSAQANWHFGTQWAGDDLHGSKDTDAKPAGLWLASYYHAAAVPCLC